IPVDLGPVQEDFIYHTNDPNEMTSDKFCQRNWVEFKLSDLAPENWQGNTMENKDIPPTSPQCKIDSEIDYINMVDHFSWARKRDIWAGNCTDVNGNKVPCNEAHTGCIDWQGNPVPCPNQDDGVLQDDGWVYKIIDQIFDGKNDVSTNGPYRLSYIPLRQGPYPNPAPRHGNSAWVTFSELAYNNQDLYTDNENDPFLIDYWDFYSINAYVKKADQTVTYTAGIPGGGLRVKRLSLNSGWVQKTRNHTSVKVTEYAYDNDFGIGGTYSSGAIGLMPPPYSNSGDDRRMLSNDIQMTNLSSNVTYRNVAEIHPDWGRRFYRFLSSADVSDYYTMVPTGLDDPEKEWYGLNRFYDQYILNPHQRFQLNRLSHLIGLPWASGIIDAEGNLLSETYLKYIVTMNRKDINEIAEISLINQSDALSALSAFTPAVSSSVPGQELDHTPLYSGSEQLSQKANIHHQDIDENFGKTVQRYRHRWNFSQVLGMEGGGLGGTDPRWTTGLTEIEEVVHGCKLYSTESIKYDKKKHMIVNKKTNEYFDFITGEPLVERNEELDEPTTGMCLSCDKNETAEPQPSGNETVLAPSVTNISIPAYWVSEYANGPFYMNCVFKDPNFKKVANGMKDKTPDDFIYRNMISQGFSNSTYSNLPPYEDTENWRDLLRNKKNDG
ncbi:MAG TPA: hypothetical protein VHO70_17435, partial [Chitinispirillaceae bacterium]|nr:hypothetical protein [Chitinispirillaceae bacterium]